MSPYNRVTMIRKNEIQTAEIFEEKHSEAT